MPRGLVALGAGAVTGFAREGTRDLHWKAGGDALVQIFRSGGPALNKLGQLLATRTDVLPAAVCERLEALYDRQPAMTRAEVRRVLRRSFGRARPIVGLSRRPLAVGSVGQVHRARLRDGRRVVVKLLRPGMRDLMRRDLNALRTFVELYVGLHGRSRPELRELALKTLADFECGLEQETDFQHEAAALQEFGRRFAGSPRVCVPACHREWCTSEVLVIEELDGQPLSELRRSDPDVARQLE